MKKILFVILSFFMTVNLFCKDWNLPFGWGQDKDLKNKKSNKELLSEIQNDFGVDELKLPEEYCVDFKSSFLHFDQPEKRDKFEITTNTKIIQKNKIYTLQIAEIGLTPSYAWRAYFRLIDETNKCTQSLEITNMDQPIFALYDCNFDGCLDLVIQSAHGQNGTTYEIYYWNKGGKKFNKKPDEIVEPVFDLEKKYMIQIYNEKLEDKSLSTTYTFYTAGMSKKKFKSKIRLQFYAKKEGISESFGLHFSKKQKADFNISAGVYYFGLPLKEDFDNMDTLKQKAIRVQYNNIVKQINGI